MTLEQLADIEQLVADTTPGPWQAFSMHPKASVTQAWRAHAPAAFIAHFVNDESLTQEDDGYKRNMANARFVAAMREYALPLVQALRESEKALEETQKELEYSRLTTQALEAHNASLKESNRLFQAYIQRSIEAQPDCKPGETVIEALIREHASYKAQLHVAHAFHNLAVKERDEARTLLRLAELDKESAS